MSEVEAQIQPGSENFDPIDYYGPWVLRGAIIGLGTFGALGTLRTLRSFAQFRSAAEIPSSWIRDAEKLRAVVLRLRSDASLDVRHVPHKRLPAWLYGRTRRSKDGVVNVHLSALNVFGHAGRDHLNATAVGKTVNLTLLQRSEPNSVDCEVCLLPRWRSLQFRPISVNHQLVSHGLARVENLTTTEEWSTAFRKYVERMEAAEATAMKRGVGPLWHRESELSKSVKSATRAVVSSVEKPIQYAGDAVELTVGAGRSLKRRVETLTDVKGMADRATGFIKRSASFASGVTSRSVSELTRSASDVASNLTRSATDTASSVLRSTGETASQALKSTTETATGFVKTSVRSATDQVKSIDPSKLVESQTHRASSAIQRTGLLRYYGFIEPIVDWGTFVARNSVSILWNTVKPTAQFFGRNIKKTVEAQRAADKERTKLTPQS